MVGHKINVNEFKMTESISSILSDYSAMRLEINYKRKKKKSKKQKILKLTNMLLNNQWITEDIKKEIKKCLETNDDENMTIQNPWDIVKAVL